MTKGSVLFWVTDWTFPSPETIMLTQSKKTMPTCSHSWAGVSGRKLQGNKGDCEWFVTY